MAPSTARTTRTSTNVFVPYFIWRRPTPPSTSSQRRRRCRTMRAAPPMSQGRIPPGRVRPVRSHAAAPTRTRKPRGARTSTAFFKALLIGVSRPPALALHPLVGQEQAAGGEAHVEDDVL